MDLRLTDPGLIAKNFTCHMSRWWCQDCIGPTLLPCWLYTWYVPNLYRVADCLV